MMYELTATRTTPLVKLNLEEKQFIIDGRSLPEKGILFYESILDWMNKHLSEAKLHAVLLVKLQYCNTSSYKGLMMLFKGIEKLNEKGNNISVKWFYDEDDEDWLEDGKTFEELVTVPFMYEAIIDSDTAYMQG